MWIGISSVGADNTEVMGSIPEFSQTLDPMIVVGPFQLRKLCDICITEYVWSLQVQLEL